MFDVQWNDLQVRLLDPKTGQLLRGDSALTADACNGESLKPMPKRTKPKRPELSDKSTTLVNRLKPKQTPEQATAEMMVEGLGMNAVTAVAYSRTMGELDLTECMAALIVETQRVQSGNMGGPEAMLTAQAMTLNAMFTQLSYHSSKMTIVDQIDRFTRLALKAQGQCRATLETLAAIKNPPTVFARQANIVHGPQQVNNSVILARAEKQQTEQFKVLEAHGERLDLGAASTAGAGDQALATVGTRNRPAHG